MNDMIELLMLKELDDSLLRELDLLGAFSGSEPDCPTAQLCRRTAIQRAKTIRELAAALVLKQCIAMAVDCISSTEVKAKLREDYALLDKHCSELRGGVGTVA